MKSAVVMLAMLCLLGGGAAAVAQSPPQEPEFSQVFVSAGTHVAEPLVPGEHGGGEAQTWYLWPEPPPGVEEEKPYSATVGLNQDVFFGFYATLWAAYEITDGMDFTFYSILWTTPDFSFANGGQGLWTEVGVGLNFRYLDDELSINPQIGVLNGTLLSGAATPRPFEGVVPNLTVNYDSTWVEGQFYMGYYLATRSPRQNDFLHWWVYGGFKPFAESCGWESIISAGLHIEHLRLMRTRGGAATTIYHWVGPYVQFALPNDVALWFGAGADIDRPGFGFYKATISYSF